MPSDYRSIHRVPLSKIELTLIVGGQTIIRAIFDLLPADVIFRFGRVNFLISEIVHYYSRTTWDGQKMLNRWVGDTGRLYELMKLTRTVICGPIVSRFFDRFQHNTGNLDVVVDYEGLRHISRFLRPSLFDTLYPENLHYYDPPIRFQKQPDIGPTYNDSPQSRGKRNYTVVSQSWIYRHSYQTGRSVTLHLIQGDPLEFLVACASSTWFNLILKITSNPPSQ